MRVLLWVILLWSGFSGRAEDLGARFAGSGTLIMTQFVSAPFPHVSRTNGHTYKGEAFTAAEHYSDATVALFVPAAFRATNQVDVVIHFHGWRNTVAGTLTRFDLVEQLVASRRNAVLMVPEGPRNAPDSSGGKLEETNGFRNFMAEAMAVLQHRNVIPTNAVLGRVILSGHSGGYQVMSSIVAQGGLTDRIREVWLFDALYARGEKFRAWADQTGGRLLNIYTDGGGTKVRTEEMMAGLRERQKTFLASTDREAAAVALRTNQSVFLHTDLGHNDVLARRKTFQLFLETSCLREVAPK